MQEWKIWEATTYMESREESNVKNVLGRYAFIGQSPFYRGRVTAADNDTALIGLR